MSKAMWFTCAIVHKYAVTMQRILMKIKGRSIMTTKGIKSACYCSTLEGTGNVIIVCTLK